MIFVSINYIADPSTELLFKFTEENGLTKISDIITVKNEDGFGRISDTTKYGKFSLKERLRSPL